MLVRFWGTRGSLAAPLTGKGVRAKIHNALLKSSGHDVGSPEAVEAFIENELTFAEAETFGGNTSCVEIDSGTDEYVICDLGTGIREFGNGVMGGRWPNKKKVFHIFMSHVHWDHIMGFPFFVPAYVPGHTIKIYGGHTELEHAFRKQQSAPCFPVDFDILGADIEFITLDPEKTYDIAGMSVTLMKQYHAGDSYGYRFEQNGKSVVYSTDSEHKFEFITETYEFIDFFRNADLLIFDAMYSLADAYSLKEDWGHSSNITGVELSQRAGVKHFCMFHHEPNYDDATIEGVMNETIRFEELSDEGDGLLVSAAYDGREIEV